jgi:sugar O-acyltransferase (sialic acid O-acetyltransferase NeuD family)
MEIHEVRPPQLGVNDDEVKIAKWFAVDGSQVKPGDLLATLETTKATLELECDKPGFLYSLAGEGGMVKVGDPVALILAQPSPGAIEDWKKKKMPKVKEGDLSLPTDVQATNKARALIGELGIPFDRLPRGRILREADIMALAAPQTSIAAEASLDDTRKVLIWGAGNGGLTVRETLLAMGGWEVAGFLDKNPAEGSLHAGLPVWPENKLEEIRRKGVGSCIVAISDRKRRLECLELARRTGFSLANAIHPRAYVSPSARLGGGLHIKSGAVVETETVVGMGCIIDNNVSVPHHNHIGDGAHLAPGAALGSSIRIGPRTLVGIGATLVTGIRVGADVIIGAGAVVDTHVEDNSIVQAPRSKMAPRGGHA